MKKLKIDQFGVMSVYYPEYSIDYMLDSIAANGFKNVDFWGGAPHYSIFSIADHEHELMVDNIRHKIEQRGLHMSVFTPETLCLYPINVAAEETSIRQRSIDICKQYIEDAKRFGAKYYFMQMGWYYLDGNREKAWDRAVRSLQELVAFAEKLDQKTVMEQLQPYESGLIYNRATLKQMVDTINSPYLTACVDCVAAAADNETPEDYFRAFGNHINHIHIADGTPTGHLCPGDGTNPLYKYLSTLANHDYEGSITIETNNQIYFDDPDTATAKAFRWLKKCPVVE